MNGRHWPLRGAVAMLFLAIACGGDPSSDSSGPGASGNGQGKLVFTLRHVLAPDHPVSRALDLFANQVEKRSNGEIAIHIEQGDGADGEKQLLDGVMGDADAFAKVSFNQLEPIAELAKINSLPYLYRDENHLWKVLNGPIGQEMLDFAQERNLKGICFFDAGFRSFYTKAPVKTVADLRGLKLRAQPSVMMQKLIESFGALPQPMAFGELYAALDRGAVAGAENNIPSYFTGQHYKAAPCYIFDNHVSVPDVLLMSLKRWNALKPDQQALILDAAKVAQEYERKLWQDDTESDIAELKKLGATFTYPDAETMQGFVDASKGVYDEFKGTKVMEYVDRIRAVK